MIPWANPKHLNHTMFRCTFAKVMEYSRYRAETIWAGLCGHRRTVQRKYKVRERTWPKRASGATRLARLLRSTLKGTGHVETSSSLGNLDPPSINTYGRKDCCLDGYKDNCSKESIIYKATCKRGGHSPNIWQPEISLDKETIRGYPFMTQAQ